MLISTRKEVKSIVFRSDYYTIINCPHSIFKDLNEWGISEKMGNKKHFVYTLMESLSSTELPCINIESFDKTTNKLNIMSNDDKSSFCMTLLKNVDELTEVANNNTIAFIWFAYGGQNYSPYKLEEDKNFAKGWVTSRCLRIDHKDR